MTKKDHLENTATLQTNTSEIPKAIVDANTDMASTGNPYNIDSLSISGDTLSVFVNYSGGCETHSFDLYSNGMYAKSSPPQLSLCLKHSGKTDQCKKLIMKELKFNVTDLKYKGSDKVILKIADQRIAYVTNK
jgi:hypothetical protein